LSDFFTPTPSGFASIDELEDLIGLIFEEPGAYRSVDGRLWSRYRTSGSAVSQRDRYNVLREIWTSLSQTSPQVATRVLAIYGNQFGTIPRIANESQVTGFAEDDPVFSDYVSRNRTGVRILPDGTPSDPLPEFAPRRPVEGPAIAPFPDAPAEVFSPETRRTPGDFGIGAAGVNSDTGRQTDAPSFNDSGFQARQDELREQERLEFIAELDEQLRQAQGRLSEDQASLAARFGLGQREALFNQVTGNLAGPVGPGVGNLFSGFQRQRRGLNNTRFGFDDAQRRLAYAEQLRGIARQRENNIRSYQDQIEAFDAQRSRDSVAGVPIPGDEFFNGIQLGDLQ